MTAFENVMLGVNAVSNGEQTRKERAEIAAHYLQLVGLADAMHKRPAELSGGMRQRVGIARAFALNPKMLLLDEPFGMLDSLTRFELQQVLIDVWSQDRKTALMVTHDVDESLFLSDRVVMMTNGPAARVGDSLEVPFARPRDRKEVMEHPDYYRLREHLIAFLEEHANREVTLESPERCADAPTAGNRAASRPTKQLADEASDADGTLPNGLGLQLNPAPFQA
jgi:ABC-type nitrate/sulfonate/bicarbonate transport system ATPase subunit